MKYIYLDILYCKLTWIDVNKIPTSSISHDYEFYDHHIAYLLHS